MIVYEFSDYKAPLKEYQVATEAISFTIDPSKTTILQYGFEEMTWIEKGYREYSYFVPDGVTMRAESHLLIVLGDDIADYSLQGYKNGSTELGNELDTVSSTVTRYEGVLSDVVSRLIDDYFSEYGDGAGLSKGISKELYFGALAEFLYQHRIFANKLADLQYKHQTYTKGNSPDDVEGGEVYNFEMAEGDYPRFSYIINGKNNCYLLIEGEWYSVSNLSNPPVSE